MKRNTKQIAALFTAALAVTSSITTISAGAETEKELQLKNELVIEKNTGTELKRPGNTELKPHFAEPLDLSFKYIITDREPVIIAGKGVEKGNYTAVIKKNKTKPNSLPAYVRDSLPADLVKAALSATQHGEAVFCTDMTPDMLRESISLLSPLFDFYVHDQLNDMALVTVDVTANTQACILKYGETVQLSAAADGGIDDLTYQWYKNGIAVKGATSPDYTATEPARYSCTVTDYVGLSGSTGVINVVSTLSFTKLPENKVIAPNGSTELSVEISGGLAPYTYQWYKNNVEIPDSNSATCTATSAGQYKCRVTDSLGQTITGRYGTVSVAPELKITVNLSEKEIVPASGSRLRVQASGGYGALSYQWYKGGVPIDGATDSNYAVFNSGLYHCEVTDSVGQTVKSRYCEIIEKLTIASNPSSAIIAPGKSARLSVGTKGGTTIKYYQWYKNGKPIQTDGQGPTYYAREEGSYYCVITDTAGQKVYSYTAQVSVADKLTLTSALPTPKILERDSSGYLYFVYTSGGYGTVKYKWYHNGSVITGATKSEYNATAAGTYYCEVTDSIGQKYISNVATLYDELYIKSQSKDRIIEKGDYTYLSVTMAGGSAPLQYQWYKDYTKIPFATDSTYKATETGTYYCVITDGSNQRVASESIKVVEKLRISKHPTSYNIMDSPTQKTKVSVTTTGGYGKKTYQWFRNGYAISGATSSSYTIQATGDYYCRVRDEFGQYAYSNYTYACLKLTQTGKTKSTTIPKGSKLTISFTFSGGRAPFKYQWYKNNALIPNATNSTYDVTESGYYSCKISDFTGQSLTTDYISIAVK